jgi:hypothetical protein
MKPSYSHGYESEVSANSARRKTVKVGWFPFVSAEQRYHISVKIPHRPERSADRKQVTVTSQSDSHLCTAEFDLR